MTLEQFFEAMVGRKPANQKELDDFSAAFSEVAALLRASGFDVPGRIPSRQEIEADQQFWDDFSILIGRVMLEGTEILAKDIQATAAQEAGPQEALELADDLVAVKRELAIAELRIELGREPTEQEIDNKVIGAKKPTQRDLFFQVLRERGMVPASDDDATFAFLEDIFVRMQRLALGQPPETDFAELVRANLPETAQELRQIQVQQALFEEEFNAAFDRQLAEQGIVLPSTIRNKVRAALGQQFEIADTQAQGKLTAQDFLAQNLQPSINTVFEEADTQMKRRQVEELAAVDPEKAGRLAAEFFPFPQAPSAASQAPQFQERMGTIQARLDELRDVVGRGRRQLDRTDLVENDRAVLEQSIAAAEQEMEQLTAQLGKVGQEFQGAKVAAELPTLGEGTGPRTARGAAEFIAGPLEQDIEGIIKAARAGIKDQDFLRVLDLYIPQLTEEFTGRVRKFRAEQLAGVVPEERIAKPDFISFMSEQLPVLQGQREAEIAGQKEAQRAAGETAAEEERRRRERERRGQRTVLGGITSIQRVPR